jgi:hypothetical protein
MSNQPKPTLGDLMPGALERMRHFIYSEKGHRLPQTLHEDLAALCAGTEEYLRVKSETDAAASDKAILDWLQEHQSDVLHRPGVCAVGRIGGGPYMRCRDGGGPTLREAVADAMAKEES